MFVTLNNTNLYVSGTSFLRAHSLIAISYQYDFNKLLYLNSARLSDFLVSKRQIKVGVDILWYIFLSFISICFPFRKQEDLFY